MSDLIGNTPVIDADTGLNDADERVANAGLLM